MVFVIVIVVATLLDSESWVQVAVFPVAGSLTLDESQVFKSLSFGVCEARLMIST